MTLAAILIILALAGTALHGILWYTVRDYRSPLVLILSVFVGFVGTLLLALGVAS